MIFYPSSLPCVSRAQGLNETAYAGVVRTPMEAGNSRQRRMHRTLPHRLSLTWEMAQTDLAAFLTWVNAYAWDNWVLLDLPGLRASRRSVNVTGTPVRFISDLTEELITGTGLWYWRVRVDAEWQPTTDDLALVPIASWIVAGTPGDPSSDQWIVAGTPGNPSPWIQGMGGDADGNPVFFAEAAPALAAPPETVSIEGA